MGNIASVLQKCRVGTVIAFKDKEKLAWKVGKINSIFPPNTKYNNSNVFSLIIDLELAITPQWIDEEKTIFHYEDIVDIVFLE